MVAKRWRIVHTYFISLISQYAKLTTVHFCRHLESPASTPFDKKQRSMSGKFTRPRGSSSFSGNHG